MFSLGNKTKAMMKNDIKVFGLFGYPLSHSVSPEMHNAALRAARISGMYFAFERKKNDFLHLIRSKRRMILDGFNLTIPYKELILPYVDQLDPAAKLAGAVNTVLRTGNRWIGYNTDIDGFLAGTRSVRFNPRGKKAVVLGAGGAARAVVAALSIARVRQIGIFNRTVRKGSLLAREFKRKFPRITIKNIRDQKEAARELETADVLVNATSVGLHKSQSSPIPVSLLPTRKILVYDLIYRPKETKLLKAAKRRGHRALNGEMMLLHQGARAFEIWTKRKAPVLIMQRALQHALMV